MRSPLNVIDVLTILPFVIEAFNELQWVKNFRGELEMKIRIVEELAILIASRKNNPS